jgi:regulator of sigma E protease
MFAVLGRSVLAIFVMLIIWSSLIIGHELAHLLVARFLGFKTPIFGFGLPFGPKFKIKLGKETELRIHPIIYGGYVSIPELDVTPASEITPTLQSSKLWQRVAVVLAGIVFYVLVSWGALFVSANLIGEPIFRIVVKTLPKTNLIGAQAGIKIGDYITALDSNQVLDVDGVIAYMRSHASTPVTVHIKRGEQTLALPLTPNSEGKAGLGIQCQGIANYQQTGVFHAIEIANKSFCSLLEGFLQLKPTVGTGISTSATNTNYRSAAVPGLCAILFGALVIGEDWRSIGLFTSMLSFILALMNLLPLPGFDGWHLVAVLTSSVRKKQFVGNRFTRWACGLWLVLAILCLGAPLCLLRGRETQS